MPLSIFLRHKKRISLIIKDHVIRCMDIKNRDQQAVRLCGERYLPDGVIREGKIVDIETFEIILEQCVQEWGIQKCEVLFLVPDPVVVVRKLSIPEDVPNSEVKGYFYMEIGASIHLPFDNPVFDYEILGIENNKKEVLFYAAPENIVLEYVHLLEKVKLKPIAADISSLAIYRLYDQLGLSRAEDHLLCIQFDVHTVNIGIFKECKLVFMRHIKMNIDWAAWKRKRDERGVETLSWSGDPDYLREEIRNMVGEIERVMNFYHYSFNQGNEQVTRLLITGDFPNLKKIEESLKASLDIPIDSLDVGLVTAKGDPVLPQYYLSLGLGLKEVR
ncbi:type IV pilus biogenesis protein PilM [Ammoniphilus resinae]|uniref:Type IV pilus assembly protein PilM n=1 Tax=Ammoniphilus resinae TaxID=861532 RepID=A0ABS4GIZ6_9BACL|nr:pilus assembly protein PilM [Ammoniphilus resinae]MBP1930225.1 type IV pilus assembly protein PilM [Ammoniphilus resinae]